MKKVNLCILGATGVVGTEMLKVLEERKVEFNNLKLLADPSEAGKKIKYKDVEYTVEAINEESFKNIDIVLSAVPDKISKMFTPVAVKEGAIVIDNSSAYRLDKDVPLVVPEVNPDDVVNNKGIIANPNCSTIIALVAINELNKFSRIKNMIVSTYQAVSGAGINGLNELDKQVKAYATGEKMDVNVFQYQIAFNLIPHIDSFTDNGYSKEEMKMHNEGRKILHDDKINISCTCVRVPVFRSHSESINIQFENKVSIEKARELLKNADGVKLEDDINNNVYPMPLYSSNQDLIYVGRIREDFTKDNSINLWCCGDQIRKGAATNAVQIAELVMKKCF